MSKHLIYMGYTGTAHRIALFDDTDIFARRIPVKDVQELPENVKYLNCTVENGRVIPHLKSAKVLCTAPDVDSAEYKGKGTGLRVVYSGLLLSGAPGWNVWDGSCTEFTMYSIAAVAVRLSRFRHQLTHMILCMTSTGELFFGDSSVMLSMVKKGYTFVQVGTPELCYPNVYYGQFLRSGLMPLVGIPAEDTYRIVWSKTPVPEDKMDAVEYVLYTKWSKAVACDLRCYKNARVFGYNSVFNTCLYIYPDSAEEIWLSGSALSGSLKAIYMPPGVKRIRDYVVSNRSKKNFTVYSSSPAAVEFCTKYNIPRVDCTDAEVMIRQYCKSTHSEYLDVADASNLAALAGVSAPVTGTSGTVLSAVLFSIADKGIAESVLHERYPVVDTCQGRVSLPNSKVFDVSFDRGSCSGHGKYNPERTRTLAAAFTQFYPLCLKECEVPDSVLTYDKYQLGDYMLYVGVNAFNPARFFAVNQVLKARADEVKQKVYTKRVNSSQLICKMYAKDLGDGWGLSHVALLVDITGKVIHRFACDDRVVLVMLSLSRVTMTDEAPCGVLRYADKLATLYSWNDKEGIVKALKDTLVIFSYKTELSKKQLVGIDLHTGGLVTAMYGVNAYKHSMYGYNRQFGGWGPNSGLNYVTSYSHICAYSLDADVRKLFAKDCVFNSGK